VFYDQFDMPHPGVQGLIDAEKKNFGAFESLVLPIGTRVAEGDRMSACMISEGWNCRSDVFGAPASGRNRRISPMMRLAIEDGRISEKRAQLDVGDIRRQFAH